MSAPVDLLARFNAEIAAADARIAETAGTIQEMYIESRARSVAAHDALVELFAAARDYAHVEENAYASTLVVPARKRLRAALAQVKGGAA
ncbi:hypothetical protein ACTUVK_000512 [Stenotrophomonas rhizophila]